MNPNYARRGRGVGDTVAAGLMVSVLGGWASDAVAQETGGGVTDIPGVSVGQVTLSERPTGCTVVLIQGGAVAGVDVRGSAPGTREVALLDPVNTVQRAHAIFLSGGSAFGLDVGTGVTRFLEERGEGFDVGVARVPIVPGAVLLDLRVGGRPDIRPTHECGYAAARRAHIGPVAEGNVGAGAGATIGKFGAVGRPMKGGVGSASVRRESGLIVAALVAVNAAGDVIDPRTGEVVAGALEQDADRLLDARRMVRGEAPVGRDPDAAGNTTLGIVVTNASLTKSQVTKVAQMAHDGFARTIYPAHTPFDGDVIFGLATGGLTEPASVALVGAMAAEVIAEAVLRAVWAAEGIDGYPAARDLPRRQP